MLKSRYLTVGRIVAVTIALLFRGLVEDQAIAGDACRLHTSQAVVPPTDIVHTLKKSGAELFWHGKYNYMHGKPEVDPNPGNIYRVTWRNRSITPAMTTPLRGLYALEELHLYDCRFDRAAWKGIKKLKIKDLCLIESKLTKKDIEGISRLKGLRILCLYGTEITDQEVSLLGPLTGLRELNLEESNLTDRSLEAVGKLTNLRRLMLNGAAISDAGIKRIAHLKEMTCLDLRNTKITDQTLVEIQGMAELEELLLDGTAITDVCIPQIRKFKKLRWLDVSYTKMSDAGFERLRSLNLRYLRAVRPLTPKMIDKLREVFPQQEGECEEDMKKQRNEMMKIR